MAPLPANWLRRDTVNKKIIIAAVVAVIVGVGAFFGGMAALDPTASSEYRAVEKHLKDSESNLASTQEELDDAQAQLDALMSGAQDDGVTQGEPAVSGGAAVAPRNFKLGVRTRSKECFGSAGCSLTVQIEPSYVGTQDVATGSWELTYEIRGGEDGPLIETMTLENGTFSFPEEQMVGTASSNAQISAVVTEVYSLS